jgi:Domain of unknown function (DUF3859)
MRTLFLGLLVTLLQFGHETLAQSPAITGARITWYGNYAPGATQLVKDPTSTAGERRVSSGILPPSTNTDRIRFDPDTRFGFGYELIGSRTNGPVSLKYVTRVPAPGVLDAKTGQRITVLENTYRNLALDRKDLFCGEFLGDYKEPPRGIWILQVWYGDRMLLEKSFTVGNP